MKRLRWLCLVGLGLAGLFPMAQASKWRGPATPAAQELPLLAVGQSWQQDWPLRLSQDLDNLQLELRTSPNLVLEQDRFYWPHLPGDTEVLVPIRLQRQEGGPAWIQWQLHGQWQGGSGGGSWHFDLPDTDPKPRQAKPVPSERRLQGQQRLQPLP